MALNKQKITGLIVGFAIGTVVVVKLILTNSPGVVMDSLVARTQGPASAKVNIVEFIDFECPACARGAIELKEYLARYPQDLRVQIKYFPLMQMHRHALQVASYSECVSRQGKFWTFFDSLMLQQGQWSQLVSAQGVFDQMAQQAGVNMAKLKSCLSSDDVSSTIMSEKALGQSLGVRSTPTYFINKKMVVGSKSLADELTHDFPSVSQ
ncbi:MAG: thioredoxin domain-containing protein [Candidatus Omnitrophica bacterium]|nr:thioredoxin domain-containing protein [Candidatus Omnitrophota bacterium]